MIRYKLKHSWMALATILVALAGGSAGWAETLQSDAGFAPNQALIKFNPGTPAEDKANIRASLGARLEESYWIVPGLELVASKVMTTEQLVERLGRNPNIEFAEPNFIVAADLVPNDTYYGNLWGMHRIGAASAWDATTGSQDYVIAVIDTGVDYTHPDLVDNMWVNQEELDGIEGTDDDGNGYVDDIYGWDFYDNDSDPWDGYDGTAQGHGSHVSGTICGRGDNAIGVVGVNWRCKIMALRFLGPGGGYTSGAISALEYALDKGVRVSNNSWGGGGYSSALAAALTEAANLEHLFIAAAGNSNVNTDITPHYPSSYGHDNVISVASTTSSDTRSSFSNYGASSVDLGAPGSSILSTVPNNGYSYYSGTSMATPHVTGAVALLGSYHPDWTAMEIRQAILDTVEPFPALDGLTVTGGLLDVAAAIEYAPGNTPPTADFSFSTDALRVYFTDASTDGTGIATRNWDFGDGNSSSETNPVHDYAAEGTYAVTLTVTDDEGASDSASQDVTVALPNEAPTADAGMDQVVADTDGAIGEYVTLNGSGSGDSDGTIVSYAWTWSGGSASGVSPQVFMPDGETVVTLTVTDNDGATAQDTVTITVEAPAVIQQFATASSTALGTSSGSYLDTHSEDGTVQLLIEGESGGKPSKRRSSLEHSWTFDVRAGSAITLTANAWISGPNDVDDFIFSYSTNGADFTDLFTVSRSSANPQSAPLPTSLNGPVYIRVVDSDNTPGERVLGELSVDYLVIETNTTDVYPPTADAGPDQAVAESDGLPGEDVTLDGSGSADSDGVIVDYAWTWNGGSASGLSPLVRMPDGETVVTLTVTDDDGLSATDTLLVTVEAPAAPIDLAASGTKVKGALVLDLYWSGASGPSVDLRRDGAVVDSLENDGVEEGYAAGVKGGGVFQFQICETGSEVCSNAVTVSF